ncbi:hypothetical protein KEHDKFFH_06825 [Marinobacter maroccanus]|uniref:Uncharacterized protein n=1 Tax=Marinobacter maroccanus TaxID=2055143 RepID=A0A2S5ZC02_9GAMM|nr:hypothetical protein [Marinobacter maroccanus]PPI84916.1 hypothetical protein KEHDKFFH_06825 [Marinobacter maroccanus]
MSAVKAPSCAPSETFWLELTGQQSLAGHEYVLSEIADDGNEVVTSIEICEKHNGRKGPILAGHVEQPKKRSLILQLKGDETINVPVIDEEFIGPYALKAPQRQYQDNLMVSVHPTLFCDAGELTHPRPMSGYEEAIGAPVRTGWIYVFFRGRLWRELSVVTSEDAAPVLRDTPVAQARTASLEAANDRKAIGPELDVIHVPARLNGTDVYSDVYLAFSETQWSWEYISALEQDSGLITTRCRSARAIRAFLEGQPSLDGDWKRLDEMPVMRARDSAIESDFTFPGQWLHDVDGAKSQQAQDALIAQRDAIEADEHVVDADYFLETPSLYPRWRQLHLQNEPLPTIQAGTDVFGPLRDRHLITLHLRDSLQAARHLAQQMNAALALMLALVDNVKKRPFGVTAELFHNNFRRETLPDGSANPLYIDGGWFDNRIDESEGGRLQRTLYDVERAALRDFLTEAQAALVRLLNDERPQSLTATLRDLFALESGNTAAGYVQTGPLLQVLSLPAHRADPLVLPQESDANGNDEAAKIALKIATGEHPLGAMLLPFQDSSGEYQVGDATLLNLKSLVEALEDRSQDMRVLEPNVLRSMADHQEQTRGPDGQAIAGFVGRGASVFSSVAGEISQWWLTQVQSELTLRGAAFTADINRIKSAFEGFAEAAIPGRTTLQMEGADEGRTYIVLEVLDEQGNTLTSGAAVGAALRVSDYDAFDGVVKHQPVKRFMHQVTAHPGGLPSVLVVFDVWNFRNTVQDLSPESTSGRAILGVLSAFADLGVSSAQFATLLPQQPSWLEPQIVKWRKEAKWFARLAASFNTQDQFARAVVRNQLQAAGWLAGMFTTALMVSDSVSSFANGRWGAGSAQLIKAGGAATMVSADIIAARLLTPVGRRAVERTADQALQAAIGRLVPAAARWTGTVASGYVTALGFAIYVVGEIAFYRMMDDAVSKWLRAGPFSGDPDEQTDELASESNAYIALVKAMTPVSLQRIPDNRVAEWLQARKLTAWQNEAEAVLSFASPALAITGKPADIELVLSYEQEHYRLLGPNPAGGWRTGTIARKSGTIRQGIQNDFDEQRQSINFMIGKSQLSDFVPQSDYERVETRYRVKSLSLTFTVDVWNRGAKEYQSQEVTHTMEDLDVEWQG